jgi:hypothetical protein
MDLNQIKLSKTEWNSIETPVSENEKQILKMISDGFTDVNIKTNNNQSLLSITKIEHTAEIEAYLYDLHFKIPIQKAKEMYEKKTGKSGAIKIPEISAKQIKKLKRADIIRMENIAKTIEKYRDKIVEFVELDLAISILDCLSRKSSPIPAKIEKGKSVKSDQVDLFGTYTLIQLKKSTIPKKNSYLAQFIDNLIAYVVDNTKTADYIYHSPEIIEKNAHLLKYTDITLFAHQKQLFSIVKNQPEKPKLILYTAPTGTGKTLSPLGLVQKFKVIFVCVARHVGLALAKSAISIEKKIAFAFGCETPADIRLHNYAATDFIKHHKSGAIAKIDNSVGDKVEMIICDVKSYLVAMRYMLAFNKEPDIITYWDEPTITMDYEDHELHKTIHENWAQNKISKMVLSCATLPKEEEIADTLCDFRARFEDAEIYTINSHDCRKTISLTNKSGYCVLPHLLFSNYGEILHSVLQCETNKSLLRYLDLGEIIRFLKYVNMDTKPMIHPEYKIDSYFGDIANITMESIKFYYLEALKRIPVDEWPHVYTYLKDSQLPKFGKSGIQKTRSLQTMPVDTSKPLTRTTSMIYPAPPTIPLENAVNIPSTNPTAGIMLTTEDAHTLTDGPTIFLADDVNRIAKFYVHNSKIPDKIFGVLMEKIEKNSQIQHELNQLVQSLEDTMGAEIDKSKKMEREQFTGDTHKVMNTMAGLRQQMESVSIDHIYVPNTTPHQQIWAPNGNVVTNAFVPRIDQQTVKEIMELEIDNSMKLLLLLGIGVFSTESGVNVAYMEIMKRLAYSQQLYIIVASSDYIYGTNYQFCHGFIGKDLTHMTQQKIIQALGRIGRNNIQQEYSVRFRDDGVIAGLFQPVSENLEALKMSELFCSA